MGIDFSVVIPAYNESNYLEPTLRSIRAQDYGGNIEIIVVDNNSTTTQRVRGVCDVCCLSESRAHRRAPTRPTPPRVPRSPFIDPIPKIPNLLSERHARGGWRRRGQAPPSGQTCSAPLDRGGGKTLHRFIGPVHPYLYATREVYQRRWLVPRTPRRRSSAPRASRRNASSPGIARATPCHARRYRPRLLPARVQGVLLSSSA